MTPFLKVEKFSSFKSYLDGNALNSIKGFSVSESNYDEPTDILKNRFGHKDLLINAYMNKLLNCS